jgi:LPXTG-site transpeptidase (sortase) family protein
MKSIGIIFIISGVICLSIASYILFQMYNPNRLKFVGYEQPKLHTNTDKKAGMPKYLIIKDLGINLEVVPSSIKDGVWETTYKGVSYLSASPKPGDIGNSIFYGHNWSSLLGNLKKAKPGQTIRIIDEDGYLTDFKIAFVQVVDPNNKSILDQTTDSRLTIYTCIGLLDSKRLVVTAIKE